MTGKRIGYKRVSTHEQNPESQLIGIKLDKIYVEYETGYSTKSREKLHELLDYIREDDELFVECMDRLGRNGTDLDKIVDALLKKQVTIHFVREGITLGKKNDLMSKLAYDMMKSFIHFFSQLAKERQRIGIEKAKKDGKYKGRKTIYNEELANKIREALNTRKTISQIARDLRISRHSLYKFMKKIEKEQNDFSR